MSEYSFDNIDKKQFGKELLETHFGIELESSIEQVNYPNILNFIFLDKRNQAAVLIVDSTTHIEEGLSPVTNELKNIIKDIHPSSLVILSFTDTVSLSIKTEKKEFDRLFETKVTLLDKEWIENTVSKYPILQNYFIDYDLTLYSVGYYIVDAMWSDKVNHTERFIKNNIWEHGFDGKYEDIINSVKIGDIFILKITSQDKSQKSIRINAVGVVTLNHNDGHKLNVDWKIRSDYYDASSKLSKHKKTIQKVDSNDFIKVLQILNLSKDQTSSLYSRKKEESIDEKFSPNIIKKVPISNDTATTGEDLLGFKNDIRSFASLIALK